MVVLFANSGDPDHMPCSAACDLGLHCLPVARLGSPVFTGLRDLYIKLTHKYSLSLPLFE